MIFDLRGRLLWMSPAFGAGSPSPGRLVGLRWIEFIETCDQLRVMRWLVSAECALGIEFRAMNPFDGTRLHSFYRKIPYGGRWLVLSESVPLSLVPPQKEFDFSTLETDNDGSIEEPDTYEGGGGGGGG
jgi:hypothetical protein